MQQDDLQSVIAKLQDQIASIQQQQASQDNKKSILALSDEVAAAIPLHLQYPPMESSERKKLLSRYPKIDGPRSVADENGLASRLLKGQPNQLLITKQLPSFQKDCLDILRISASSWQKATELLQHGQKQAAGELLMQAIKDITSMASDNAQRIARFQLQQTFEAANVRSAYSLMDFTNQEQPIDSTDNSILQQSHLDAMAELRKFQAAVDKNKGKSNTNNGNRGGKGTFSGNRPYFNRGGKGNYNNFRSQKGGKGFSQGNFHRQNSSPGPPPSNP